MTSNQVNPFVIDENPSTPLTSADDTSPISILASSEYLLGNEESSNDKESGSEIAEQILTSNTDVGSSSSTATVRGNHQQLLHEVFSNWLFGFLSTSLHSNDIGNTENMASKNVTLEVLRSPLNTL